MKRIVVTTDLSLESKVAFPLAVIIAKTFGSEVVLLAVIEDPSQAALIYALDFPVFPDPDIRVQLTNKIKGELSQIASKDFAGTSVSIAVREASASVHHEIIQHAGEVNADLIIIATQGRTGLKRMIIGSVAEKVVRESLCPVLTVPGPKRSAT